MSTTLFDAKFVADFAATELQGSGADEDNAVEMILDYLTLNAATVAASYREQVPAVPDRREILRALRAARESQEPLSLGETIARAGHMAESLWSPGCEHRSTRKIVDWLLRVVFAAAGSESSAMAVDELEVVRATRVFDTALWFEPAREELRSSGRRNSVAEALAQYHVVCSQAGRVGPDGVSGYEEALEQLNARAGQPVATLSPGAAAESVRRMRLNLKAADGTDFATRDVLLWLLEVLVRVFSEVTGAG